MSSSVPVLLIVFNRVDTTRQVLAVVLGTYKIASRHLKLYPRPIAARLVWITRIAKTLFKTILGKI